MMESEEKSTKIQRMLRKVVRQICATTFLEEETVLVTGSLHFTVNGYCTTSVLVNEWTGNAGHIQQTNLDRSRDNAVSMIASPKPMYLFQNASRGKHSKQLVSPSRYLMSCGRSDTHSVRTLPGVNSDMRLEDKTSTSWLVKDIPGNDASLKNTEDPATGILSIETTMSPKLNQPGAPRWQSVDFNGGVSEQKGNEHVEKVKAQSFPQELAMSAKALLSENDGRILQYSPSDHDKTNDKQITKGTKDMEKEFVCDDCGQKFSSTMEYTQHKAVCGDKKPYICGECGSVLSASDSSCLSCEVGTQQRCTSSNQSKVGESMNIDRLAAQLVAGHFVQIHREMKGTTSPQKFIQDGGLCTNNESSGERCQQSRDGGVSQRYRMSNIVPSMLPTNNAPEVPSIEPSSWSVMPQGKQGEICGYCGFQSGRTQLPKVYIPGRGSLALCQNCEELLSDATTCTLHHMPPINHAQVTITQPHSHARSGHGREYVCKVCSKRFHRRFHLVVHERVHTGEKPYACRYCNKMFSQSSAKKQHERIHTGEKPFVCRVCKKAFSDRSTWRRHEMLHA